MKFETILKLHFFAFYGGLISTFIWISILIALNVFSIVITDTVLGVGFLLWGLIGASLVVSEAGNYGAGFGQGFP